MSGYYTGGGMGWGSGQHQGATTNRDSSNDIHDPEYRHRRQEQLRALDDDYRDWRERYRKLPDEFSQRRQSRQGDGSTIGGGERGSSMEGRSHGSSSGGSSGSSFGGTSGTGSSGSSIGGPSSGSSPGGSSMGGSEGSPSGGSGSGSTTGPPVHSDRVRAGRRVTVSARRAPTRREARRSPARPEA